MPRLYPVIHHTTLADTLRMAGVAADAGCDGVFLISMAGRADLLTDVGEAMRAAHPGLWLGVNRFGARLAPSALLARELVAGVFDALWEDNPGLHSTAGDPEEVARLGALLAAARRERPTFRYFGSVAFKTQPREPDPEGVAVAAARAGWTPTTSGSATGVAADPGRIARMKAALLAAPDLAPGPDAGARPAPRLAIASGITPENAAAFVPAVDDFLVATGISVPGTDDLDPARVRTLRAVLST